VPQEILNLPKDKPLIYCAMGSSANRAVLRTVLESFDGAPYTVISPMKAHFEKEKLRAPSNVHLFDWLPADKVNPLADVAVIHGGQGTVQTACASGTPFVGIGLQPEQEANIDMIARQGCAIRLGKRNFTRQQLLQSIESLLKDEHARKRAKEIQSLSQAWDGTKNAAKFLIETFG
jgi:UDP:flavonoid glycosyltransferase YjiC (YdhE family)